MSHLYFKPPKVYADNDFKSVISSPEELKQFMVSRSIEHGAYFHYTSVDSGDNIFASESLWLWPLKKCNDLEEHEGDNFFQISFSSGSSENIPMWYLYSGVEGKGVRLSLTKSKFRDLIYNSKYTLCEIQSDSPGKSIITKEIDTPIDMVVQDILYMDIQDKNAHMNPRKKETRIKYNGKNFFSKDFIRNNNYTSLTKFCSDYKKKSPSFCKGLAWFYEKETRLSVTVPEGVLMPNVKYIIKLDFGEKYKNFKIRFGPEIVKENVDQIMQRNGYKKLANQDELSDYSGKIKMGLKNKLCGDCKHTKNTNNTLENK